jgi:hypothetical protein
MRIILFALAAALTLPAFAQETPLPRPRPDALQQKEAEPPAATDAAESQPPVPLPRSRPPPEAAEPPAAEQDEEETGPEVEEAAPAPSEPEPPEPPRIYQTACPAVIAGLVEAEMLPPLVEGACGERSPLLVTAVVANGRLVPFSSPATLNCPMATALPDWAAAVDGYVWARENIRIARILTGTSFMCRGRNGVDGADTSEHGFANALDVIGFELEDGRMVTLPEGWRPARSAEGRLLRFAHDAGCARFTTTLGPEANALHADHLHLDMGCHGERCTARLCE